MIKPNFIIRESVRPRPLTLVSGGELNNFII